MEKHIEITKNPNSKEFNVIMERDSEGYYVGSVVELPGCHTQAKTKETLIERMKEAVDLYLEVQGNDKESPEFIGTYKLII